MESTHINGIMAELLAQMYFAKMGYQVFTPIMPQSRTDLIALKDGVSEKIQVKKATLNVCGENVYLQIRLANKLGAKYTKEDVDFFFVVWDKHQWKIPFEELDGKTSCTLCKMLEDGTLRDNTGKSAIKISEYEIEDAH